MLAMMIMDQWWWLMLPGLLLGIYAQIKLSSTYSKYLRVEGGSGKTGAEAAREILDCNGLHNVPVHEQGGRLTDHYDPTKRALVLSSDNYHGTSLSAIGVAAHEAGHALQHKEAYVWLTLRMKVVPATQFASWAVFGIILLSVFLGMAFAKKIAPYAVGIFGVIAFFQLITLPVEFDASHRAKEQLKKLGIVRDSESAGVSKVLSAAALTYVAAMIASVMELIHWILIARSGDDS